MRNLINCNHCPVALCLFVMCSCDGKTPLQTHQVEALRVAAQSTELMMEHGSSTYLEVLVVRQSLLQVEMTQAQNRLAEIIGVVNLYTSLGGGF